jgi:hypothetical protein
MAAEAKVSPAELVQHVADAGGLIGVNASAKLLGVAAPNFKRYRPRLTEVPVEGSAAVFVKAEVEALASELSEQRAARAGDGA